jgi:AcrR family transcriptional regulator
MSPPRPAPRTSVPLSTRLAPGGVLAAALEVFEKKGFAQARVEDILEVAGIARRTFYRHFKSKEEVLAALYQLAIGEILSSLHNVENEDDPLLGIRRGIDVYLDYHAKNAGTLRLLMGQSMRPDSPIFPMRKAFRAALVQIMDHAARKHGKQLAPFVFVALISALEGLSFELLETGVTPAELEIARQTVKALLAKVLDVPGPPLPRAKRAS